MSLGSILGKMAECMKVFTRKIKSMAMGFILGQTLRSTLAGGMEENNMELEYLYLKRASEDLDYGKTERK